MAKEVSGIQINEERPQQRREWRIERIGWVVMGALLLAGLLGLLGSGPLARAQAGGDALSVDYECLQRAKAPTEYRFEVNPALMGGGPVRLRFDDVLLEEVKLERIVPEPDTVRAGPGYTEFEFAMGPGTGAPAQITFQFEPTTFGHVAGRVTAPGTEPLVLDQFVFP